MASLFLRDDSGLAGQVNGERLTPNYGDCGAVITVKVVLFTTTGHSVSLLVIGLRQDAKDRHSKVSASSDTAKTNGRGRSPNQQPPPFQRPALSGSVCLAGCLALTGRCIVFIFTTIADEVELTDLTDRESRKNNGHRVALLG